MNIEKMKEMIRCARAAAKTDDFRLLVDNFEAFVDLYSQKGESQEDAEYIKRLSDSHRTFWASFEALSSRLGLTPDSLRGYFENPNNFSPKQWQEMQMIKQEIVGEKPVSAPPKKLRKNSKKVRI